MESFNKTTSETYVESNTVVFYDTEKELYVEEVDEYNIVIGYTEDINQALSMPNTLNFKNSKKYITLLQQADIQPLNKIVNKITEVNVKGL